MHSPPTFCHKLQKNWADRAAGTLWVILYLAERQALKKCAVCIQVDTKKGGLFMILVTDMKIMTLKKNLQEGL
jgi:hypothetical protein